MIKNKWFGHYQVKEELGRGGMGVVYKAWEASLDRFVAIKVLADNLAHNENVKERFIREAKAMATINHPNVIHIHLIGEEKGIPYFAMEYIHGKSLNEILKSGNVLSLPHAKNIIYQACKGLVAAHNKNLIHRDIKPDNLMLTEDGLLKIVDFGIALSHKTEEKLTNTGEMVGTPGYVSPEACIGKIIDKRADIFSLGIVFYQILAGRVPFENDSPLGLMLEVVQAEILDVRKINKKIDKNTSKILNKMVLKSPDDRYQNCEQIIVDLGRIDKNKTIKSILADSKLVDLPLIKKNISSDHTIINSLSKTELNIQNTVPLFKNKFFFMPITIMILLFLGWYFTRDNLIPIKINNEIVSKEKPFQKPIEENNKLTNQEITDNEKVTLDELSNNTVTQTEPLTVTANNISNHVDQNQKPTNKESTTAEIKPESIDKQQALIQTKQTTAAAPSTALKQAGIVGYNCIEVYRFKVDRENHKNKELERAAKIPDELVKQIQFIIVGEIIRGEYGLKAIEPKKEKCPNNKASLILTGLVTDYKKGSKTTRYLVGFGAGQQKFQVDLVLKEKTNNKILAEKRVIDRKIGGLLGGTAEKGRYDFAEKVSGFIRDTVEEKINIL